MKKAQVESIGLVIIVALLAFIFVFVLQISTKPEQDTLNSRYLQIRADNLRSSLLKTNICQDTSIKDELVNCNDFSFSQCDNINCDKLKDTVKEIIENSLNATKGYKFESGSIVIEKNFNLCNNVYTAAKEPIPNSNLEITLSLC